MTDQVACHRPPAVFTSKAGVGEGSHDIFWFDPRTAHVLVLDELQQLALGKQKSGKHQVHGPLAVVGRARRACQSECTDPC